MSKICVYLERVDRDFLELHFDETVNVLYPERKSRVLAFRRREPAYASVTAGLMLQRLVQRELAISPENLRLVKNENGKPTVEGHPEFCFNLSHSGDWVALAYGWDTPVGIDIEGVRRVNLRVAKRCYTAEEYRYVEFGTYPPDVAYENDRYEADPSENDRQKQKPGDEILSRFVRVWTMKEAYLKLTGQGISVPINTVRTDPVREILIGEPYRYDMRRMEDYWLAVCVRAGDEVDYAKPGDLGCVTKTVKTEM